MHTVTSLALALFLLAPLGGTSSPVGAPKHQQEPRDREFSGSHFRVGTTRNVGQQEKRGWRLFGHVDEHLIVRDTVAGSELRRDGAHIEDRGLIGSILSGLGGAVGGNSDSAESASSLSEKRASRSSVRSEKSESRASVRSASRASAGHDPTPTPSKTSSSDDSSPTSSCGDGLLDGVLCGLSSAVAPKTTSSSDDGKSSSKGDDSSSSSDDDSSTRSKSSSDSTPTSSCGDGLLDGVLCGVSSVLGGGSTSSTPKETSTSDDSEPTKSSSSESSKHTSSASCGDDGLLDGVLCGVSSVLGGGSTSDDDSTKTSSHKQTSTPGGIISSIVSDVSSVLGGGGSTTSSSDGATPTNGTHTSSGNADQTSSSSDSTPTSVSSEVSHVIPGSNSTSDAGFSSSSSTPDTISSSSSDDFVPSSTLLVTQAATTSSHDSSSGPSSGTKATTTSMASIPSSTPQKIIPGDGTNSALQQPDGTTLISILFNGQLNWEWLVSISPNTSAQIFKYMPGLVSSSLDLPDANVTNYALVAYVPAGYNPNDDDGAGILSVWLAFVPQNSVSALQAYIKTPKSPIYAGSTGIENELAQRIDPSLLITAYSTGAGAGGDGSSSGGDSSSDSGSSHKTTIIAVVVSLGVVALLLAGYLIYRMANKNGSSPGPVRLADNDAAAHEAPSRRTTGFFGGFGGFGGGGAIALNRSPSQSTTGSGSSLTSYSSSGGHATDAGSRGGHHVHAHGRSTSVDTDDRRASWWRYSQGSAGSAHSSNNGAGGVVRQRSPNQDMPIMREGPRRIQVVRSPGGGYTGISKPVLQESSLLL